MSAALHGSDEGAAGAAESPVERGEVHEPGTRFGRGALHGERQRRRTHRRRGHRHRNSREGSAGDLGGFPSGRRIENARIRRDGSWAEHHAKAARSAGGGGGGPPAARGREEFFG